MTVAPDIEIEASDPEDVGQYLGLSPAQRYELASRKFPDWLLREPVEFPPDHETFGWACLVEGCMSPQGPSQTHSLCQTHIKEYRKVRARLSMVDFAREAQARGAIVVDYFEVPDGAVPAGWPPIVDNAWRLQRLVYHHTRDFLRRVSAHVAIGAAYKDERPLDHYFVLCRQA